MSYNNTAEEDYESPLEEDIGKGNGFSGSENGERWWNATGDPEGEGWKNHSEAQASPLTVVRSPDVFAPRKNLLSSPLFPARDNGDASNYRSSMNHGIDLARGGAGTTENNPHAQLMLKVDSWIHELKTVHEKVQRTSVQNAILLDSLYMTGAVKED